MRKIEKAEIFLTVEKNYPFREFMDREEKDVGEVAAPSQSFIKQ